MSLIREALKKAGDGKEPAILLPDKDTKRKKIGSSQIIKFGLLIVLLLALVGGLAYLFLPTGTFIQKGPPPPTPQLIAKKVESKPQGAVLVPGKDSSPPINPQKVETKSPQQTKPERELEEKGMAQKSDKIFKTLPPRFLSPRPIAKISPRPALPARLVTHTKPPKEVTESSPVQVSPEGMDSLKMVRLFNESVKNQHQGLFSQAIQGYQEILTLRPNHWETYNNLGLIYQEQKQVAKALEMFQKTLSLNPRYLKGYNNLGLLYLNLGKLEEAVSQFRKALEIDPEFIPASINLAVGYRRQGQVELARKCLQKVLDHDSESLEAHYNLGLLWEDEGIENKAVEHYQKFVSKAQGPYCDLANELRKRWPGLK
jgi:Tfp pilus assembly protein PilF